MSSSAARALDDDQLVFGALLPAVHGRFTSSRSYLSPDLSSSYRVAFIIFWCAAPVAHETGGGLSRQRSAQPRFRKPRRRLLTFPERQVSTANAARAHMWPHLWRRRLSVRASSSALPLLRLPTVLFPSQPLSLRLTQSDAEGAGGDLEAPDLAAPAELVSSAWRDFDGKVVAVGPCGHAACRICPCLMVPKLAAPAACLQGTATLRVRAAALPRSAPAAPLHTQATSASSCTS